ncbi:MAG: DNA cytosine methyltransferase [Thermodesulfobacteriota bacterium]
MKTAHLFSGAGGGLLADLILGHRPVLAVEWEEKCCDSLRRRSAEGWLPGLHVHHGDVRDIDFTPWGGRVDCIAAGFPCQDISAAGQGAGIEGARSGLVSEVFRAIDVVRPGLVFLENSPNIRTKGRHIVIGQLVARGYAWKDGILGAADVGAPHQRDRWWCLAANADGMRQLEQERRKFAEWGWLGNGDTAFADHHRVRDDRWPNNTRRHNLNREDYGRPESAGRAEECTEDAPNTDSQRRHGRAWAEQQTERGGEFEDGHNHAANDLCHRLQIAVQRGGLSEASAEAIEAAARYTGAYHWSPPDAGVCGMVDGVATEMDGNGKGARIKACGNGQVSLAAAAAWVILCGC